MISFFLDFFGASPSRATSSAGALSAFFATAVTAFFDAAGTTRQIDHRSRLSYRPHDEKVYPICLHYGKEASRPRLQGFSRRAPILAIGTQRAVGKRHHDDACVPAQSHGCQNTMNGARRLNPWTRQDYLALTRRRFTSALPACSMSGGGPSPGCNCATAGLSLCCPRVFSRLMMTSGLG